jgi:hypothetical protein
MKKIIFALIVIVMTTPAFASSSSQNPVKLRWTSSGLQFSSPAYKYQTRQVRSEINRYERMPKQEVRKAFRNLDRNINNSLKKMFR